MNIRKCKITSVCSFILISGFAAVAIHADSGKPSLFAENSGLSAADHSLDARFRLGRERARSEFLATRGQGGEIGIMILTGIAGNIAGIYSGVFLGLKLSSSSHDDLASPVLGGCVGSVLGSASGVYLAGKSQNLRGTFGSALLGSSLGVLISMFVSRGGLVVSLLSFAILPPVCSAIAFERSQRYRALPSGGGLLNLAAGKLGLEMPDVQVRPVFVPGCSAKPEMQFNVKVLSVEI